VLWLTILYICKSLNYFYLTSVFADENKTVTCSSHMIRHAGVGQFPEIIRRSYFLHALSGV